MNQPAQHYPSDSCQSPAMTSIDPVCGMTVKATSPHRAEHARQQFGFCSAGCRTKFLKDPKRYLAVASTVHPLGQHPPNAHLATTHAQAPAPLEAEAPAGTIYTCPMHPEVRQIGPGHCP